MDSDEDSDDTTTDSPIPPPAAATIAAAAAAASSNSGPASSDARTLTSTSPPPPSFTSIGSPEIPTHLELQQANSNNPTLGKGQVPMQLKSDPQGDAYPSVAKVEGMLDKSEGSM